MATLVPQPWKSAPIPPIPDKYKVGFVAHSVTAAWRPSDLVVAALSWSDVKSEAPDPGYKPDAGNQADDVKALVNEGAGLLAALWGVKSGSALVFLGCGTVAYCPPGADLKFAGFAPGPAAKGVEFALPPHRLRDGKRTVRAVLADAQARFDKLSGAVRERAGPALALLTRAGYPNPGISSSDADVVALWTRPSLGPNGKGKGSEWLALVACKCFNGLPGKLGVLVRFSYDAVGEFPYAAMERFAAAGRDHFRYDILGPTVAHVHVVS